MPNLCDEQGNIDSTKLDALMPWSDKLSDECMNVENHAAKKAACILTPGAWFDVYFYLIPYLSMI